MFGRLTQGQQRFFVNSQEIPGVQSVVASYQNNAVPALHLGNQTFRTIPDGVPNASISVNRYVFTQDYFIGMTGQTGFNGALINTRNNAVAGSARNFTFVSGYMNSYRLTLGLDGIPQTNTNFVVFNQFGGLNAITDNKFLPDLNNIQTNLYSESLKIPAPWTVDINIDNNFSTNRVQSLDLQISPNFTPLYSFGDRYPKRVEINYPIEVSLTYRVEIDEFRADQLNNYPENRNTRNVELILRSHDLSETISAYRFSNLELLSETYTAGVGNNIFLDGVYRGFLGRI